MSARTRILIAAAAVAVLAVLGGVALASGEDEAEGEDVAITGTALEQASQSALDHVGEGRVTDTEVGDEESYYEVEVTLDDGREVDVQLDEDFNVVGEEYEDEGEGDDADSEDDRTNAETDEDEASEDGASDADADEGPDVGITGDALTQASAKALEAVEQEYGMSGTVTDTEVGDEESYYEVEVTLEDDRQVDVQLDENFDFLGFD